MPPLITNLVTICQIKNKSTVRIERRTTVIMSSDHSILNAIPIISVIVTIILDYKASTCVELSSKGWAKPEIQTKRTDISVCIRLRPFAKQRIRSSFIICRTHVAIIQDLGKHLLIHQSLKGRIQHLNEILHFHHHPYHAQ